MRYRQYVTVTVKPIDEHVAFDVSVYDYRSKLYGVTFQGYSKLAMHPVLLAAMLGYPLYVYPCEDVRMISRFAGLCKEYGVRFVRKNDLFIPQKEEYAIVPT